MILQLTNAGQLNATATAKVIGGVAYQVYPAIMLVEGVHHGLGSDPVYYPPKVLEASTHHWNNMPVTIHHPIDASGAHVMCNSDGSIRMEWEIGKVANVKWEDGKLKADLMINIKQVNAKQSELLTFLQNGGMLEVSTGLLAADDGTPGTWNGEDFSATITEIIPDHLALLPNSIGACSWNDGCGVRFNKEVVKEGDTAKIINAMEDTMAKTATPAEKAICAEKAVTPADKAKCKEMTVNAMIENQDNAFVEADREWLVSLNEAQFSKIIANAEPKEVIKEIEKIVEKVIDNTKEAPTTLAGWLDTTPPEIRAVVNAALKELDNKRAGFIAKIMTAETNKFTDAQLKEMDINVLESIISLMPAPAAGPNYAGMGGGNTIITNQEITEEVYVPRTLSDVMIKK